MGPNERPLKCYKAFILKTLVSKDKEAEKILLKKLNPILRNGFLAVSAYDDLIQVRIKVGKDLVEMWNPLPKPTMLFSTAWGP